MPLLGGFIWGISEATVFFIVPDVLISLLALQDRRRALWAACGATLGAALGGALVYGYALHHALALWALFDALPAIDPALYAKAASSLDQLGGVALVGGAFTGIPYKLFAAQAALQGYGWPSFIVFSFAARGARFLLVALLVHALARALRRFVGPQMLRSLWLGAWVAIYVAYWQLWSW